MAKQLLVRWRVIHQADVPRARPCIPHGTTARYRFALGKEVRRTTRANLYSISSIQMRPMHVDEQPENQIVVRHPSLA